MDEKEMHTLLEKYSTSTYFIEYQGSLSNHISQAIIALYYLGASQQEIEKYCSHYAKRLEPPKQQCDSALKTNSIGDLIGARASYYSLKEYYINLKSDLSDIIAEYLPKFAPGMVGSAVHGLIYTGYGFAAKSRLTTLEGLAYLHYCNMPLETSYDLCSNVMGNGDLEITEALEEIKKSKLYQWMLNKVNQEPWKSFNTPFQRKAAVLFSCKGDLLVDFVHRVKIPDDVNISGLEVPARAKNIATWFVEIAATLYVMAERRNDFFLLHGVTSAWSLLQIISCLKSNEDVNKVITCYLAMLVTVYIVQDCQPLNPQYLYGKMVEKEEKEMTWDEIKEKTLKRENEDEHVYKLVQVCLDMVKKTPDKENLYKRAVYVALNSKLTF